jgi:flagellar hook-length control protein FliK
VRSTSSNRLYSQKIANKLSNQDIGTKGNQLTIFGDQTAPGHAGAEARAKNASPASSSTGVPVSTSAVISPRLEAFRQQIKQKGNVRSRSAGENKKSQIETTLGRTGVDQIISSPAGHNKALLCWPHRGLSPSARRGCNVVGGASPVPKKKKKSGSQTSRDPSPIFPNKCIPTLDLIVH